MQAMQQVFTSNMQPIQTYSNYPRYARSETKPVIRARQIIDHGIISEHPCSTCVELGENCYRWEGTFSKCAYCTSKDRRKDMCHLPGQEVRVEAVAERRKRRKITQNIYAPTGDAASNADTTMSGTGAIASRIVPVPTIPIPRNVRSAAPSPEPAAASSASATTGLLIPTIVAPPTTTTTVSKAEANSAATLERVTALENQVSGLEAKYMDLRVKLDEASGSRSLTPVPQAVAGAAASPTTSTVTFEELQARNDGSADFAAMVAKTAHRAITKWALGPNMMVDGVSSPMEIATVVEVGEEAEEALGREEHTVVYAEGV